MRKLKDKNEGGFDKSMADAFCYLATEPGLSPSEIETMRLPRFFILLNYIVEKSEKERKEIEKSKGKGKSKR